jgi:hypothetical protein
MEDLNPRLSIREAIGLLNPRMIARALSACFAASFVTLVVIGLTTDVIPNPLVERDVPVHTVDWILLISISVLAGALAATYFLGQSSMVGTRVALGSGALCWLAILLGTLGATGILVQAVLGVLAVGLALVAFAVRLRMLLHGSCPVPTPPGMTSVQSQV